MFIRILSCLALLSLCVGCQNDCEENAPKPLSFHLQWVDEKGADMYTAEKFEADSLFAFYKKERGIDSVELTVAQQSDTTQHYIDVMPLVRKAFSLQIDTVFIAAQATDIDTIILKVVKEENDCFSTSYRFEKLQYNTQTLSGTEELYKIKK